MALGKKLPGSLEFKREGAFFFNSLYFLIRDKNRKERG